ncbi:phosphonopyruvate decarboxylase [Micromonospora sp. WMMD1082]|uniref:phosphonopyruvate decarboxylase n=1 Tax=Micromonospora sp. WMMD1082 TaxID=3016104 RepID=UPI002417CD65|nr:phosphonopyruvate decarboxylase [Micromonospora sp. WMMD1082]MDG4795538.1 phosphonopyruvate decarboxylase [Micromonospora sp. WMMD1082]
MIGAQEFVDLLAEHGVDFFTGVPCSYLAGPIAVLGEAYLPAANEGIALAVAAGAASGGARPAMLAQNSGFGNLINPLTSLLMPYRIPALLVMTLRGWPDPNADEPQHRVMGKRTHQLLDTLGIAHRTVTADDDPEPAVKDLMAQLDEGLPAALLVAKGAVAGPPEGRDSAPTAGMGRDEVIDAVVELLPDALLVSTTGYASRALFARADSPACFYMQGSMGHASAFGLGVVLTGHHDRRVVVLDGDGAALMHLGAMATVGAAAPAHLVHIVLDNGSYESTGGQPTRSKSASFASTAEALGYRRWWSCRDLTEVRDALRISSRTVGPCLITVRTAVGAGSAPPRATSAISAPDIFRRFSKTVTEDRR